MEITVSPSGAWTALRARGRVRVWGRDPRTRGLASRGSAVTGLAGERGTSGSTAEVPAPRRRAGRVRGREGDLREHSRGPRVLSGFRRQDSVKGGNLDSFLLHFLGQNSP